MKELREKKVLILNFCTITDSGLDTYAKIWHDIYDSNSIYLNLHTTNEFKNVNYWLMSMKYILGFYNDQLNYLDKFIKKERFDIVHITDTPIYSFFIIKKLIQKLPQCKFIYTMHDPYPHIEKKILKKIFRQIPLFLNKKIYKLSLDFTNFNVHIHSKKMIPKQWDSNKILIQQHPLVKVKEVEDIFLLSEYKIIFTFIGRLEYYKGLNLFIETIKSLEETIRDEYMKNVSFVIAGRGNIDNLNLNNSKFNIKIINKFLTEDEFDSIIKHSTVIVLPYLEATQSGVLAKAIYAEKVCIVSNKGALSDFVLDNESGFIIEPKIKYLKEKIKKIIEEEVVISFFYNGIKKVKSSFNSNSIKEKIYKKINEIT